MDVLEYSSGQYRQAYIVPENPRTHADSRNSKKIQGVHKTLDFLEFLESAWVLGFSGKSLLKEREDEIYFLKITFPR